MSAKTDIFWGVNFLDLYQIMQDRLPGVSFDQSAIWFKAFIGHVAQDEGEVICYCALNAQQEPICLMPMWRKGRMLTSLSNYYTTRFEPLLLSGNDIKTTLGMLISGIAQQRPSWGVVDLNPLDAASDLYPYIINGFKANGFWPRPYFRFANWYLEVAGRSFEQYWASVPSTLRNTLERKKRKLAREASYQLRMVDNIQDLAEVMADYEEVYEASWKGGESHPDFIRGIMQQFAKAGLLRLGLLYIQDKPVAAQLWFVKGDTASIFKLAYAERFEKYSVGSILTEYLMRHVIDVDKVQVVDFLSGDEPYKKDWMSHRRERVGLRAFNLRTLRGLLLAIKEAGAMLLKRR